MGTLLASCLLKYRALAEPWLACHFPHVTHSADNARLDLAVVGAGLNGSLLALAAGEAGLRTALIDRLPLRTMGEAGFDGRTTAITWRFP